MGNKKIYYEVFGREIQRVTEDKARVMSYEPRVSWAVNTKDNNIIFLEILDDKIKEGYTHCDMWLRGLLSSYVKRCSHENGDSPYLLEYYIDWINNTVLILNGKYPAIESWCNEYKEWIIDYFQKESILIPCQSQQETYNNEDKQVEIIINEEALKKYFISIFKGAGNNNTNYFDYLIEDIKKVRNPKDAARMALLIYESDKMIKTQKPNTFKEWHSLFCIMTGCAYNSNYKPSNLDTDKMKSKLSYL
ncbi:hypothetical protein [Bacteroides sp. GM023]|uniref:hypothetical protein n=1 Tax=Bacteroides sp. GM023 TaxID=2723058 RepID=UPI00168B0E30|nr:hypothetical protein [Bacteroides sp. GM023]MBD3591194.1 hypothetical protein [Bacteroides sp. GM023]